MAKDTKERILAAALEMFSQNGYAGTNIRELTASLGLGKSSMYRHFESKEDIWNALLDEMIAYYEARFGSPERLPPVPDSPEGLVEMTMRMVNITVRDERIVMTRKLLSIEQFRDDRARALATRHFLTGLEQMFTPIFAGMMDKGLIRRDDARMLAFAYTAPISALIHLCDREPEKTDEAMAKVEAFSRHFVKVYGAAKRSKMLNYRMVDLPRIAIIGKEGLCTKDKNVVGDLWQQANSNFSEVADLGMKNADGSLVGFWGAMSDETMSFMPWTDNYSRGLYLAGVEVYEDAPVPDGWVKWVMPARKYIVTDVAPEGYAETFRYVIDCLIPELGMKLAGAACDSTEPATGQNKLFFPVE